MIGMLADHWLFQVSVVRRESRMPKPIALSALAKAPMGIRMMRSTGFSTIMAFALPFERQIRLIWF